MLGSGGSTTPQGNVSADAGGPALGQPGLLHRLIEPAASVEKPADRRRARILAGAMLVVGGLGLSATVLAPLLLQGTLLPTPGTRHGALAAFLNLAAYGISRTPRWRQGAMLGIGSSLYGTWASVLLARTPIETSVTVFFVALPIVLAGALLGRTATLVVGAANVAAVLIVPGLFPVEPQSGRAIAAIFITLLTTLVVVLASIWTGDLAEIDKHRQSLAERESRLRTIMDNIPLYVLLLDGTGKIVFINHVLPGLKTEDVIGSRATDWFEEPTRTRLRHAIDECRAGRMPDDVEGEGPGPNGARAHWWLRIARIHTTGNDDRILAVAQDITERKTAETERLHATEREVELEKLRQLSAFKTSFLNMAAHELSTPMTPVVLSARLLSTSIGDEAAAAKHLDSLQRNVERLRALLADLLEAARTQSHRISYTPVPLDLRDIGTAIVSSYTTTAENKDIQLETDMAPDPVDVRADPARISQVLGNLVDNAIKYSPPGAHVTVRIKPIDQGGLIEVADTGIGLSAEQQTRLFQPFERVHAHGPDAPPGTGLGLYIIKGIVERHGGTIECESRGPETGTRFRVMLPREPPDHHERSDSADMAPTT